MTRTIPALIVLILLVLVVGIASDYTSRNIRGSGVSFSPVSDSVMDLVKDKNCEELYIDILKEEGNPVRDCRDWFRKGCFEESKQTFVLCDELGITQ